MSIEVARPLSFLHVDFDRLYERHLGRHSQFGINVAHVVALYGLWFGAYSALYQAVLHLGVPAAWSLVVVLALTYLVIVSINAPLRVTIAMALFLAVFVMSVIAEPKLPVWWILVFAVMAPAFYKFQSTNHKIWTKAADMTEFNRRFPPGRALNVILLLNEIPICLNYLIFNRKDWRA